MGATLGSKDLGFHSSDCCNLSVEYLNRDGLDLVFEELECNQTRRVVNQGGPFDRVHL